MSTEIKLTVGIIILSIIITFVGIKLAYRQPLSDLALNTAQLENASNPRLAGKNSKIDIVEFADFECPSCAAMHPIIKKLIEEEGDKVTLVYRNFPIHQDAEKIGAMVLAAGKQNKFWEMHDLAYETQSDWAEETLAKKIEIFDGYAKKLSLNLDQFHKDSVDKAITDIVANDQKDATAMKINSTPTIIINGKTVIRQVTPYAEFKKAVDAEIASK